MDTYYKILGVTKESSEAEITKAFRKRALETHPDKNKDALPGTFERINQAYKILKDAESRKAYDLAGGPVSSGDGVDEEDYDNFPSAQVC
jgi:curved DNA-binding protein CbpA